MFRFEDPIYLWALLIIPVLMLIRFISGRKRRAKIRKFGDPDLVKALMPDVSKRRPRVKFALLLTVLALLILMLARPQMGTGVATDKRAGIETIICLDVSNSMLCQDVEPSRLDKSKMLVENMVDRFNNDKIGLIVFAGEAYVQLPITADYVSAKMFLSEIEPGMIQTQGTDIGLAIDLATHSFSQDDNVGRAIIVITDAEDHEGGAEEAAKAARKQGINVFILGVGSTKGAPIPMGNGSYLKDRNGNTVMTALNEGEAQKIAAAGSGTYIHVDNTSDAEEKLNHELTKLQRGETTSTVYSAYDEQFQALGIVAVVLLIIETLISEARNSRLNGLQLFRGFRGIHAPHRPQRRHRRSGAAMLLLPLLLMAVSLPAAAQQDRHDIREGNRAYRSQKWTQAETAYRKALAANSQNPQALYNLGCALMQQGKMKQALDFYKRAAQAEPNKIRRARSYHNMGCMYQAKRDYGHALEMYKQALLCNPHDNETRYNYVLCKRLMKNSPQNQNNKSNKNNKNNKNKNNQNKNNKNNQSNKNNQNKQNQDKNNQNRQNQNHQPKMSKENAEQLLNAAIQQEQATKQKLQQRMTQPKRRTLEDNW